MSQPEPTRVMQTITEGQDANCMQACIASLFGIPLEQAFATGNRDGWIALLREWARERGYGHVCIGVDQATFREIFSAGYLIVAGVSQRGRKHAVIYKDGALWHDPHPEGGGIAKVEEVDFFYPLSGPNCTDSPRDRR